MSRSFPLLKLKKSPMSLAKLSTKAVSIRSAPSFFYNLFNSKPHDAILTKSSKKELEKFYAKDIEKTRLFLEQKQISKFPEWMKV